MATDINPNDIDHQKVGEALLRLTYGRVRDLHLNWTPQACVAAAEELIKQGVVRAIDGEGKLMLDSSRPKVLIAAKIAPRFFPPTEGSSEEAKLTRAYQLEQRALDEARPRPRSRSEIEAELAAIDGTDEESKCRRAMLREALITMGAADA